MRILLADDHPHVLANLCRLAEEVGEVVAAVADARAVVRESLRLRPEVVVLDLSMPELSGLEVARGLRRNLPETKVIICTVHMSPKLIAESFSAGAGGFVWKQSAHEDLAPAIRAALAGETFVSPSLRSEGKAETRHDGPTNDA